MAPPLTLTLGRIQVKVAQDSQDLTCKRFVDFIEVNVVIPQAVRFQQSSDRFHRAETHQPGFDTDRVEAA